MGSGHEMAERTTATDETDAAGFVLAGGRSSRMGRNKALIEFAGKPLVAHALGILHQAGIPAMIAGAAPSARASLVAYAPVVDDLEPGLGPLAGVCAALAAASSRFVVFLPVDLPLLPPSLIAFLLLRAQITGRAVTVASVNGFLQTFPAVLDRSTLPGLERELHSEKHGCFSAFQAVAAGLGQPIAGIAAELLAQSGHVSHPLGLPPVRWFINVNAPQDLHRAKAL